MRRVLVLVVVLVTALLLQTTVFSDVTLLRAKPELVYLVAIVFAIIEGPNAGAVVGFIGGMAQDFLSIAPKGITALTLTLLGYVVGLLRQYIVSHGLVSFLLGQLNEPFVDLARVAALSALYNAVLTPLAFPLLRRLAEGSQAQRVHRW